MFLLMLVGIYLDRMTDRRMRCGVCYGYVLLDGMLDATDCRVRQGMYRMKEE